MMIILIISHNYNNVNVIINRTLHLKHVKRSIQKEKKQKHKVQSTEPEEGAGTSRDTFFFNLSIYPFNFLTFFLNFI